MDHQSLEQLACRGQVRENGTVWPTLVTFWGRHRRSSASIAERGTLTTVSMRSKKAFLGLGVWSNVAIRLLDSSRSTISGDQAKTGVVDRSHQTCLEPTSSFPLKKGFDKTCLQSPLEHLSDRVVAGTAMEDWDQGVNRKQNGWPKYLVLTPTRARFRFHC